MPNTPTTSETKLVLPHGLPEDVLKAFEANGADFDAYVQAFFRIKNKAGEVVPFRYNRPQKLNAQRTTAFDMVLKARKLGISSRRIARDLFICATVKHQHRILLTHTGEAADKIMLERIVPLIKNSVFPLRAEVKKDHVYFPYASSVYYAGTAGAKKFSRGDDVTGYHFSEYAHWPSPDVVPGIEEALVDNADGLVETTANGHNFFKMDWDKAKLGKSQYRAIFLPWFSDEDYARDPAMEPGPLSEEEKTIMEAFSLSLANLAWRRWKKRTMRDPSLFPQEYPETDEEAFLSTGRPVFDKLALTRLRLHVADPRWRGYLQEYMGRVSFHEHPEGELRIWKMPEEGHVYGIGADVAEGVPDGAYSTGEVLDVGDSEQVAEWHGHIAPDRFATPLNLLSKFYHQAIIAPEEWPGPGEVTASYLAHLGARLWASPNDSGRGFRTDAHTKPQIIAVLNAALRDFGLVIRSKELLAELQAYVYNARMEMVPSAGNFADRIMGMAIIFFCTRDLASRVDYYKAPRPEFSRELGSGGTSVPAWLRSGQVPGRRQE